MRRKSGTWVRFWIYFRRGHTVYAIFVLSVFNFVTIQYALLVKDQPWLHRLLPSALWFSIAVAVVYVPVSLLLGYLDYKRWSVPAEVALNAEVNPALIAISRAIRSLAQDRPKEAEALMNEWLATHEKWTAKSGKQNVQATGQV